MRRKPKPERARGVPLALRHGLDGGPEDLGREGRQHRAERDHRRGEGRELDVGIGQAEIDEHDDDELRQRAEDVDEDGDGDVRRAGMRMARTMASASPVSTPTAMVSSATSTVSQNPPRIDGAYWARTCPLKKLSRSGVILLIVPSAGEGRRGLVTH